MDIDPIFNNLVDLHCHLGSSSTPYFLWEMAHEQGIKLPTKNYWEFIDLVTMTETKTYNDLLEYFHLTEQIQSSLIAIEKATHHAVSLAYRKSNITTLEIRFNPMFRNRDNENDLDRIILAAIYGMKKACIEYPVKAGLILMMDRRLSVELNTIIVEKAIKFSKEGIIGIDIAGPIDNKFKVSDVAHLFLKARENGLGVTLHTGEATGTEEMWDFVNMISPDRIGHGVKSAEDEKLLDILAQKGIVLEVCPSANHRIGLFKSWYEFKQLFEKFDKHGVIYTINSDSPCFLQTNVKNEFKQLIKHEVLMESDIRRLSNIAKKSTFIK
jgi:adenosine deaminase